MRADTLIGRDSGSRCKHEHDNIGLGFRGVGVAVDTHITNMRHNTAYMLVLDVDYHHYSRHWLMRADTLIGRDVMGRGAGTSTVRVSGLS